MRSILGLLFWVGISFSAGLFGSRFMPGAWYETLSKPALNPPNWVFGPVWTALYLLMGIAAWRVWVESGFRDNGPALGLFVAQLVFNGLWSYLFFGLHRPDLAMFDLAALWVLIVIVTALFYRINLFAGSLMLPYLAWVTFAGYLNFALWRLNAKAL